MEECLAVDVDEFFYEEFGNAAAKAYERLSDGDPAANWYPGHTIMVCCFDNAQALRAKPLLIWYRSLDPDRLVVPALDCHTGEPPCLDQDVTTDHWVLFGTDDAPPEWGAPVAYPAGVRHKLRAFLPDSVIGDYYGTSLRNGDFAIAHDDLLSGDLTCVERLQPSH